MVNQIAVILEAGIGRQELDVLFRKDPINDIPEHVAPIKFLRAPEQNVLGFKGVSDYHLRERHRLDKGLNDGPAMP